MSCPVLGKAFFIESGKEWIKNMKSQLENIKALAEQELSACTDLKVLETLRVKYLGKKGELTAILKQMGKLSAEERPVMG